MSKKTFKARNKVNKMVSEYVGLSEKDVEYLKDFQGFSEMRTPKLSLQEALKKKPLFFKEISAYTNIYTYRDELNHHRYVDLMTNGSKVNIDPTDPIFDPELVNKIRNQVETCGRCLKGAADCHCETAKRKSAYSEGDWRQDVVSGPEEAYTEMLDTHVKAFDLLPTGDAPDNLPNGTPVMIAIPKHSLRGKLAYIVRTRRQDGKYEVIVHDYKGGVRGFFSPNELKTSKT